jgi:hypothetical protein
MEREVLKFSKDLKKKKGPSRCCLAAAQGCRRAVAAASTWPARDPLYGGRGQPTDRSIGRPCSSPSDRGDAVNRRVPSRRVFFLYKADGQAVRLTSSFPLALAGEVRCSIWLVLKTIH